MKLIIYISFFGSLLLAGSCIRPKGNMPDLKLMLMDSTTILNTRDIPTGKPSLLIFFSPDCEHCQSETRDLLKKMDSLKKVNLYFITIDSLQRMKVFNGYFGLHKYPNVIVARDYTYSFASHFPKVVPPYTVLYDKYKRARVVMSGEAEASKIISLVNQL